MSLESIPSILLTDWTPVVTFATPGDLSVTYNQQIGKLVKLAEKLIFATIKITTATFTHTTASGDFQVTGLPIAAINVTGLIHLGAMAMTGFTLDGGYTNVAMRLGHNSAILNIAENGSALAQQFLQASNTTSGTNLVFGSSFFYYID